MAIQQKPNPPRIVKVKLNRFSLYALKPDMEIDISEGVLCLAGANGLGKSTFLAAINYAITGIVRNPDRKYESISDYYRDEVSTSYSSTYFTGRIDEDDRELASISVELRVGSLHYHLTRGIFEPGELRDFSILKDNRH